MAEVIKYTVIGNQKFLNLLDETDSLIWKMMIYWNQHTAIFAQKAEFVSGDIREGGKRLFLNLGHTIGHAIEISST